MSLKMIMVGVALLISTIASGAEYRSSTGSRPRGDASQTSSHEQRLVEAVNVYRARYKLPPLEVDRTLMSVARERVPFVDQGKGAGSMGYNHMACRLWCRDHARRAGFTGPATDNLAMGHESPEDAVQGWANEDKDRDPAGHNLQMRGHAKINSRWVDEHYDRIGVAISGRNYIAIFGRAN